MEGVETTLLPSLPCGTFLICSNRRVESFPYMVGMGSLWESGLSRRTNRHFLAPHTLTLLRPTSDFRRLPNFPRFRAASRVMTFFVSRASSLLITTRVVKAMEALFRGRNRPKRRKSRRSSRLSRGTHPATAEKILKKILKKNFGTSVGRRGVSAHLRIASQTVIPPKPLTGG